MSTGRLVGSGVDRRTIGAMGMLGMLSTDEVLDRVLTERSPAFADVRADLRAANDAAWQATSPRLLELCRVRIATMLGCTAEATSRTPGTGVDPAVLDAIAAWPGDARFDDVDRACLAFAEHHVIDVASLDDDTAAAVRTHLGDEGLSNLASALLVVEQRIRLRVAWDRLFPDGPDSARDTHGRTGGG